MRTGILVKRTFVSQGHGEKEGAKGISKGQQEAGVMRGNGGARKPREPVKHLEHQKEGLERADREKGLLSPLSLFIPLATECHQWWWQQ